MSIPNKCVFTLVKTNLLGVGAKNFPMQKVRTPNKYVFTLVKTHLPGGWGGLILQGVVVVDVVTFRPNWDRAIKISLKVNFPGNQEIAKF